jgi:hypothetical protein
VIPLLNKGRHQQVDVLLKHHKNMHFKITCHWEEKQNTIISSFYRFQKNFWLPSFTLSERVQVLIINRLQMYISN